MEVSNINGTQIKYKYINRNSAKLRIIFQGNGQALDSVNRKLYNSYINGEIERTEFQKFLDGVHSKISYHKFFSDYDNSDILFITDNFNDVCGWYAIGSEKTIRNELIEFMNSYTNKYEEVQMFGSSKGAYAVFNYCEEVNNINRAYAIFPIVKPYYRMNSSSSVSNKYFLEILSKQTNKLEEELDNYLGSNKTNDKVEKVVVLGISDEQVYECIDFLATRKNVKYIFDKNITNHIGYVNNNFLLRLKKLFDQKTFPKSSEWKD